MAELATERINFVSDHLDSAEYDRENQTLTIAFSDGSVYVYDAVPETVFSGFKTAASSSFYFRNYIKGRYQFYKQ